MKNNVQKKVVRLFKAKNIKRFLAMLVACTILITAVQVTPIQASTGDDIYPYTLFASSDREGAITVNANNGCVNGNIAANGSIIINGALNLNGNKLEYSNASMPYLWESIEKQYFSAENAKEFLEDTNINISSPIKVTGNVVFDNNVSINSSICANGNIELGGAVVNANNAMIISKYGDINIDSSNVNISGLIYAPFGNVVITGDNVNLNNVIVIAETITVNAANVNMNYGANMGRIVSESAGLLNVPSEEWKYLEDLNENDFPDYFENAYNWYTLVDTDSDGLPNVLEEYLGGNYSVTDTDCDGLDDYYELFVTYTDMSLADSDNNGISDDAEDFDEDSSTNIQEYLDGTDPYYDENYVPLVLEKKLDTSVENTEIAECEEASYGSITLMALKDEEIYYHSIATWEFEVETALIDRDVENYFSSYEVISGSRVSDKVSSFVTSWNNIASKGVQYAFCVINSHGDYDSLYENSAITASTINSLKVLNCQCVLVLGCNSGHANYMWSNIAFYLAQKVTGVVVASDGVVVSWPTNYLGVQVKFTSAAITSFKTYCGNNKRDNYGWIIYDYNHSTGTMMWYTTGMKNITVKSLLNYLKKTDFVNY